MADIRIKDLATTASVTASDDFMAVDGTTNGTRKLSAATPSFATSVTTPSLTSPASTNLTLAGGAGNSSIILTPAGTGGVGIGTTTPTGGQLEIKGNSDGGSFPNRPRLALTNDAGTAVTWSIQPWSTSGDANLSIHRSGSTGNILLAPTSGGNVLIGTTSDTGLTGAGGLKIASTTAGSSNAGALVVQGGISVGQSAQASYFGGAVTADGTQTNLGGANFTTTNNVNIRGTNAGIAIYNSVAGSSNNWSTIRNTATGSDSNLIFSTNTVPALTLDGSANATFAGAVTIGNTVNSVSPTSPNRTVTMVVNGVTLYLAAKTTND